MVGQFKGGMKLGLSYPKKSKSNDETSFEISNDIPADLDKKKFRRSFSQGNIFDKFSGINRFSTAINSINNNNESKDNTNLSKLVSNDVSISPCFKFGGLSDKSSKASSETDSSEKSFKTKSFDDNLTTQGT